MPCRQLLKLEDVDFDNEALEGTVVGGWRVARVIGSGTFGHVVEAHGPGGEVAALKLMPRGDQVGGQGRHEPHGPAAAPVVGAPACMQLHQHAGPAAGRRPASVQVQLALLRPPTAPLWCPGGTACRYGSTART